MSKSFRSLFVSFSRTGAGLCIYHLFVWSNLNFLHISQCITLPTQSYLVLYSFYDNSLIIIIIIIIIITLVKMIFDAKKQNMFLANLMILILKMTLIFHG